MVFAEYPYNVALVYSIRHYVLPHKSFLVNIPFEITFDKFHVMKMVNEAVDEVRREEQKQAPELKHSRYLWLKNASALKDEQKVELDKLKDGHLQTGKAYRLKLSLQELWTQPLF